MLDLGITFDYTKLVMDNELAYMVKRAVAGINVNEADMAVDIIKEVGPGGEFVSHQHTFSNFKTAQSISNFIDRRNRSDWERAGSLSMWDKANAVACDLYDNYRPTPLPDEVKKQIRSIVNEAEDHYNVVISKK